MSLCLSCRHGFNCPYMEGVEDFIHIRLDTRDEWIQDVDRIEVRITPYCHKLVGHPFKIGENPKVDAQFNVRYCVANAIVRKSSVLKHFEKSYIQDPQIMTLVNKVVVIPDPALEDPNFGTNVVGSNVKIHTRQGREYHRSVPVARGMPGNPLSREEHLEGFADCMSYARTPLSQEKIDGIISMIDRLEEARDCRRQVPARRTAQPTAGERRRGLRVR